MGIFTSAQAIYGLPYKALVEELSDEQVDEIHEMLDNAEIDYASPYYDSDREAWIVGYNIVCEGGYTPEQWQECLDGAIECWENIYPEIIAGIFITPDVN